MTWTTTTSENGRTPADEPDGAAPYAVEARDLYKRYGSFQAVDGVSFVVHRGECFGLLGPNGAGKTTVIKMLTCTSPVTAGTLQVAGHDVMREPRRVKSRLGVVPQEDNLDPDLSVRRNLEVYARFFNISAAEAAPRIDEALSLFQLQEKAHSSIDELSGGMKRRLVIARALVNDPDIVVLDEPTTGLDPQARHLVWQKLRLLKSRGVTMLLTTHYMEEAAQLCDRIVIMHRGTVLSEGSPRELIGMHAGETVLELRVAAHERTSVLATLPRNDGVDIEELEDAVLVFGAAEASTRIAREIDDPARALVRPGTLEDVFLRLTGRGLLD